MKRMHQIWRKLKLAALVAGLWLALYGHALAAPQSKGPPVKEEPGGQAWVLPYFVVLMAVGLGMLMVCRGSRRAERAKPKQYQSLIEEE